MATMAVVITDDTHTEYGVNFETGRVFKLASPGFGSGLTNPAPEGAAWPVIHGVQADIDNIARGYTPA